MKKLLTITIVMLLVLAVGAGCAKNNAQQKPGESGPGASQYNETNLSPTLDPNTKTQEVVLFFPDNNLMNTYRIKSEVAVRENEQVANAALEAWIKGPDHKELMGLIGANVIVEYIEDVNGVAHVSFSKEILEVNLGSSGELMLAEQVTMIMQQFGYEQTQLLVEGQILETMLGHLYTSEPFVANDPESYLWIEEKDTREFVLQNVAFRIYEPAPGTEVQNRIVVRGLARIFEATVLYEFEDGHNILAQGFTTASEGAPSWGEFEIIIEFDKVANNSGTIILYEESAKDGSRINELRIPVTVIK